MSYEELKEKKKLERNGRKIIMHSIAFEMAHMIDE